MSGFLQDLRYAHRMLLKTPGFTAVVVVAMGLGIGVTTMIYSVVHSVILRGLPLPEAERMVKIETWRGQENEDGMSFPDMKDVRERARSVVHVGGWYESQAYLTLEREPERFNSTAMTPGMLTVLNIKPLLGRDFVPEEGVFGKQYGSVILSHRVWSKRLRSDPNVLGRTFKMNGRVRTVVGVMPPDIRFPENSDFFIPMAEDKDDTREQRYFAVAGRLAPGATMEQAKAELATISRALQAEHPKSNKDIRLVPIAYWESQARDARPQMIMLMAAVTFVLLIAIANVANLMLARATARQRELSLRSALGASRHRIARQLLTESVLVALCGGLLGVAISYWSMDFVLSTIPIEFPYWMTFGIDGRALAFTLVISVASGLLFGMAPVLQTWRGSLLESLKDGGTQVSAGRGHHRMRNAFVIAEIALSMVLLAGAGLMVRSFLAMQSERSGLDSSNVLTGRVTLPIAVYEKDEARRAFFAEMVPRIAQLPGVVTASGTANLPLGNNTWANRTLVEGKDAASNQELPLVNYSPTLPGFFDALKIPRVAGRDFTVADRESTTRVVIVNQAAAKLLWPGQDPLGKRLRFGVDDTTGWRTVVGVVGNVRQAVEEQRRLAQIYEPHAQNPVQTLSLVIRTDGDPGALSGPVRRLLQSRDPDLPFYESRTMNANIDEAMWEQRLYAQLMGSFAFIALVIAAVGIYGVMAYSVAQRTQEIGIRMAMGAAQGTVLRMVIGQGMRLAAIGLGIGLAVAFAVTRLMASLLFGVSASDPPTYVGVIVILAGSALLACWLPALRATRVDPIVALRSE